MNKLTSDQSNRPKKSPHVCQITERDYKILRYLWKWKALSTEAIIRKFFPEIKPKSAFRRLQYLEADKYIKAIVIDENRNDVWSIADRGFKYILPRLGELHQVGYKSENPNHDFLSTAFHLGNWLTSQPENTQNYSEQQLRRYPVNAWPEWVPDSTTHRPDGYSISIQDGKRLIVAFETELSTKARDRYGAVAAYYDGQETVDLVFWLLDSQVTLNALKKSFEKYEMRVWGKHHFILLSDFEKQGWSVRLNHGQFAGKTIGEILNRNRLADASPGRRLGDVSSLLNSRRSPINTSA